MKQKPSIIFALMLLGILFQPINILALSSENQYATVFMEKPITANNPDHDTYTIKKIEATPEKVWIHISHPIPLLSSLVPQLLPKPRIIPKVDFEMKLESENEVNNSLLNRNVLVLTGKFKVGKKYKIIWPEGLRFYSRAYRKSISSFVIRPKPEIEFFNNKFIIEKNGRQLVHLKSNVNTLLLEGIQIPPVLAPIVWSWGKRSSDISWKTIYQDFDEGLRLIKEIAGKDPDFHDLIGDLYQERQIFHSEKAFKTVPVSLPLSFRKNNQNGTFELIRITDQGTEEKGKIKPRLVCITDLAITYKRSARGLLTWITSLTSGEPKAGIKIFATTRNMQVLALGETDSKGILTISNKIVKGIEINQQTADNFISRIMGKGNQTQFNVKLINKYLKIDQIQNLIAIGNNDVSYIKVNEAIEFQPEGLLAASTADDVPSDYKGYIFTDRGMYRPGDTIHFKGTVRQFRLARISPPEGQIGFLVENSKGEEVFTSKQQLSAFGTASADLLIAPHFPLGTYTIYMKFGDGNSTSHTVQVQEFRAPRHFTKVTFSKTRTVTDNTLVNPKDYQVVDIFIEGGYYAGGPVKHGQVRWKIFHTGTEFIVEGHDNFEFKNSIEEKTLLESSESILDEKGNLKITFPLDPSIQSGEKTLEVVATIIDFDGRPASSKNVFQKRPQYLIGIGKHENKVLSGETLTLPLLLVSEDGQIPSEDQLKYELFRRDDHYVRKRNQNGEIYWDWTKTWSRHHSGVVSLTGGKGNFDFVPIDSGEYQLSFFIARGDQTYRSTTFLKVGWVSRLNRKEGPYQKLEIIPNKDIYSTGESAVLTLRPQRRIAYYLVTVERDEVQYHNVIPSAGENQKIEIPLSNAYAPNVYVSILGTIARGEFPLYSSSVDEGAPSFLFGTVNISVLKYTNQLQIDIDSSSRTLRAEPGSEVTLNFSVKGKNGEPILAELAVGVVDERILALTGYQTPDLSGLTRFKIPLRIKTADLRKTLVGQTPLSRIWNPAFTGGGGLAQSEPKSTIRKNFNPVAYFNPFLVTDVNGQATVRFQLPDTMTSYRVYAVAADQGNGFGSRERVLLVDKEFYLEPGMPRFFTQGDKFKFKVSGFNKTEKTGVAELNVESPNGLELYVAEPEKSLKSNDSTQFHIEGEASHSGEMAVVFKGKFQGKQDVIQLKIPVNTGNTVDTQVLMGAFKGDSKVSFPLPRAVTQSKMDKDFLKDVKITLSVATTPFLRITEGLNYLMKYPYGCVEQTSSGVLPLAALRGLIKKGLIPGQTIVNADKFISHGVNRLFSMQTESGGFGYWPGNARPHVEGTLYALSALTVAKMNGFEVHEKPFKKALEYLKSQVNMGHYNSHFAFANYILSMNGYLDKGEARLRLKSLSNQKVENNYLWLLVGHHSKAWSNKDLSQWLTQIPPNQLTLTTYGEFNNRYRPQAIALLVATALAPNDPITDQAAIQLISGMDSRGIWNTTSDTGWALFALGEYYKQKRSLGKPSNLQIRLGRSEPMKLKATSGISTITLKAEEFLKDPTLTFKGETGKTIFYKAYLKFPRLDYAKSGHSNGWKVSKIIENLDGTDTIRVGDIVKIKVIFEADKKQFGHHYKYVVVDDPLPAGFIAINSAIKTEEAVIGSSKDDRDELYNAEDEVWNFVPNFLEFRDDRVVGFKDHFYWSGTYQFVYYARAVTEGEFVMPSTKVQLMYSPDIHGYTPVTKITILGR